MSIRTTSSFTVIESITLGADGNAPAIDVSKYDKYSYQITFTYGMGDTSAGNVSLQVSDNNVLFSTVTSSILAFTSATTNHVIEVTEVGHQWSQVNIDNTAGTGGTCKITFFGIALTD